MDSSQIVLLGDKIGSSSLRRKATTSLEKAAMIVMALDDERSQQVVSRLTEAELRKLGVAISATGRASIETAHRTILEFCTAVHGTSSVMGGPEKLEKLLRNTLPLDKVAEIMEDIKGPHERTVWETLALAPPPKIAAYLRGEFPQTAAVVLANLPSLQAARVLKLLPSGLANQIVFRLVKMSGVQKTILADLEETLKRDFVIESARSSERDGGSVLAEILNRAEPGLAEHLLAFIEEGDPETAARVRKMMFTFEDLQRVDPATLGTLIVECPTDRLPVALATTSRPLRELFLSCMSERARKLLLQEMEDMPLPRRRAIEQAQEEILSVAKRLFDNGRLQLLEPEDDESHETSAIPWGIH